MIDPNCWLMYYLRSLCIYFQHNHLPMLSLENAEKLEQLRYLEYGKNIKMVETNLKTIGIDTPEDLEKARKLLAN